MVAAASPLGCRHPLSVRSMTHKKKKPTQAEVIQGLLTQVAELRGRVEKLEQRPSIEIIRSEPEKPRQYWPSAAMAWLGGNR